MGTLTGKRTPEMTSHSLPVFSTTLSENEIERYSRQLMLRNWSQEKQLALKSSRIAFSPRFPTFGRYLAQAGVGNLFLFMEPNWEDSAVELSTVNPQTKIAPWQESCGPILDYAFFDSRRSAQHFKVNAFPPTGHAILYLEDSSVWLEDHQSPITPTNSTPAVRNVTLPMTALDPIPSLTTLLLGTLAANIVLQHFQGRHKAQ